MDEKAVRAMFERLAETKQPPSRVDIAKAAAKGAGSCGGASRLSKALLWLPRRWWSR
jgi:hypothetical protein